MNSKIIKQRDYKVPNFVLQAVNLDFFLRAAAFLGASFGILGGVGQAAALVGMGAAVVGGAVGAAANKWRKKKKKPDPYDILDEDDEYDVDYDIVGNENITTNTNM